MKKTVLKLLMLLMLFGSLVVFDLTMAQDGDGGDGGTPAPDGIFTKMKDTLDTRFQSELDLPDQTTDPVVLTIRVINAALGILGLLAVILVLYSGFRWMTAGGSAENVQKAKDTLKNALIGLAIILLAYIMVNIVLTAIVNIGSGKDFDGNDVNTAI